MDRLRPSLQVNSLPQRAQRRNRWRRTKMDKVLQTHHTRCLTGILSCASNKAASLDSQMDAVIEVKGNTSTVAVSWNENNEEGEVDDAEKGTNASDQIMDTGKHVYS